MLVIHIHIVFHVTTIHFARIKQMRRCNDFGFEFLNVYFLIFTYILSFHLFVFRFELTEGYKPSSVFKTGALNHSATLPWPLSYKYFFRLANTFQQFISRMFKINSKPVNLMNFQAFHNELSSQTRFFYPMG